ncbi:MAG: histidine kinase N-terminal 7TM domain-containing protein [Chloroflexota bacterium]
MDSWKTFTFLIPYIISFGISLSVGIYAWRRKSIKGAISFSLVAFSQASTTLGYIFELVSPSLQGKIFWDDFQWFGLVGWYIGILIFVFHFTEMEVAHPKRTLFFLSLIPALFLGMVFTNEFHGLVHSGETLIPGEPFSALDYKITTAALVIAMYGYIFIFISLLILIRKYKQAQPIYRAQTAIIFLGTVIPLVGTMLTALGVNLSFHRDYTPFTFAIGNLVVLFGIFRYHLLDIVPVAYRVVFENLSDAVFVLDNRLRLVNFNPAAKVLAPNLSNDLIGISIKEVFIENQELVDQYQHIEEVQTEIEFPSEKGISSLDMRISPLTNRRGDTIGSVIVARDITEKKLAEKAASSYASELEAANQELEAFSYSVSHDLRAPLRGIKGFTELLTEEYFEQLDSQGQEYLHRISANTTHMEQLIEDMLRLSRVTSSGMIREKVNLSVLAEKISRELVADIPNRNVEFVIDKDIFAECDQGLIQVALENLLGNALKFTGKQQESKIFFGVEERGERRIFFVRDNGVGFEMTFVDKIFSPFQRLHASTEFTGSGIGLATVQRIIRKHGGQVWAEGEVDQGATIYFTLPG